MKNDDKEEETSGVPGAALREPRINSRQKKMFIDVLTPEKWSIWLEAKSKYLFGFK